MEIRITKLDGKRYQAKIPWDMGDGFSTIIQNFNHSELPSLIQMCREQGISIVTV